MFKVLLLFVLRCSLIVYPRPSWNSYSPCLGLLIIFLGIREQISTQGLALDLNYMLLTDSVIQLFTVLLRDFSLHSGLVGCVPGYFYASDLQMHARQGYLIIFIVLRNSQSFIVISILDEDTEVQNILPTCAQVLTAVKQPTWHWSQVTPEPSIAPAAVHGCILPPSSPHISQLLTLMLLLETLCCPTSIRDNLERLEWIKAETMGALELYRARFKIH